MISGSGRSTTFDYSSDAGRQLVRERDVDDFHPGRNSVRRLLCEDREELPIGQRGTSNLVEASASESQ